MFSSSLFVLFMFFPSSFLILFSWFHPFPFITPSILFSLPDPSPSPILSPFSSPPHPVLFTYMFFFLIILLLYFLFPFPGESVVPTSSCAPPVARRPLRRRGSRYALVSSRLLPFPPFSSCSFDGKGTDELVDLVSRTLAFVLFA